MESSALSEITHICPDAKEMAEGPNHYIFLPGLKLPPGCNPAEADGLLCLDQRDGYPTRLFLSQAVSGKGGNWTKHHILDRAWHTWSWKDVGSHLRPAQILLAHLRALR